MKSKKPAEVFSVRLPENIMNIIRDIAEKSGLSPSATARLLLLQSKPSFIPKESVACALAAYRCMYKAGNNLNQIAKILNTLNASGNLNAEEALPYLNLLENINRQMQTFAQMCERQT